MWVKVRVGASESEAEGVAARALSFSHTLKIYGVMKTLPLGLYTKSTRIPQFYNI